MAERDTTRPPFERQEERVGTAGAVELQLSMRPPGTAFTMTPGPCEVLSDLMREIEVSARNEREG
jgi:hypothetical protein